LRVMRNRNRVFLFFLFVVLLATGILAQQVPVPAKDAASRPPIGERDKTQEDQIAKVFETIRADAKLPPFARIKYRKSLVQNLCTVVRTNASPKEMSGLYKTLHPESVTPELKRRHRSTTCIQSTIPVSRDTQLQSGEQQTRRQVK
jgi:hypothetical protein